MSSQDVYALAQQWLSIDKNPTTRSQIETLVAAHDDITLSQLLSTRILFGTAGLRAKMEAGFSRMNDVTVLQASQGLASYILSQKLDHKSDHQPSIVIGHDHRFNSSRFANLTAAAFLHYGFKVYFLGPDIVATPLVPFAIDHFKTDGGIMITASHNPKDDNGYKVYWGNGCQIIPPHDSGIQNSILMNLKPFFEDEWDTNIIFEQFSDNLIHVKDEIVQLYIDTIDSKLIKQSKSLSGFQFVYTAMHGVGTQFAQQAVSKLCKDPDSMIVLVDEQCTPDPNFPTVSFPNPEEAHALDLAIQTADKHDIKLVVANDPDADRFSAAVKNDDGQWVQLTGNELGFLFANYIINSLPKESLDSTYLLNSTVSSQMIKSMANKMGFHYEDTLTGFKWIGNGAIDKESQGFHVPFAYEEAIGFMFSVVHDKDGISALIVFLQMYSEWINKGKNVFEILNEGFLKFGYFKECNGYYVLPNPSITSKIFNETIRTYSSEGEAYPSKIENFDVVSWRDLTTGYESHTTGNKPTLPVDPTSQMITALLKPSDAVDASTESIRFTARGSGTEPKLKVYIEATATTEERAIQLARQVWDLVKQEWFQPEINGLTERV
ncbi:hypothetical protein CANARDRAFT_8433 [[Candida] arabinofermentans NRRL YB-2248]|uniref:Phosphoribomutase n=1 Tax=[Candida] arabinofermentans NRRL YB-2248 TaxID=983967 RepID=A0A1E4SY70_9ASCO|nr:hypothetical protein CANARDRAFT_8433 [[Candida] arabinofermentans NRRL YB-2248]